MHGVFLVAGGGEGGLPRAPTGKLGLEVGSREGETGGAAFDDAADREAVRLAIAVVGAVSGGLN